MAAKKQKSDAEKIEPGMVVEATEGDLGEVAELISQSIMSIGIACSIVIHKTENLLLLIISLHRHNRATGRKLLFVMARLFFRYTHRHKSAEQTSCHRPQCSAKESYQNTTRNSWP